MKPEIKERIEKIRKGEVPGGYKETKVEIIPEGWEMKKIENVSPLQRGFDLPSNELKNGDYPVVYSNGIVNYHSSYKVKAPGVVTGRSGTIGKVTFVEEDYWPHNTSLWVTDFKGNDPKFIYYLYLKMKLERFGAGSGVPTLNRNDVHSFKIPLPPLPEQQKIAEIISTWDKAIDLKEKIIKDRKKLRIAIVNDLLFGLKRFDEFIKSHNYNQTKYINIPEDWDFIKIGEIATEVSEKNGSNDDLPVLSCTKYAGLVDSLSYFKRQVFSEDTSTYKQVKKNCFVYATNHIDEGSIGCQNLYENSLVSPMYTVFKTNSKVNNHFLFNLLKTRLYIFIYQVNMSASVDRRGSLRWNEFSKIRIPLPDIVEQDKIVEFINSVDKNIELLKFELIQLKEQKRGLMQLLLTGIVRVEAN